jgi:hypothetical protein
VWNEYVLYLGTHYRGQEMPWHYPYVLLGVTLPTFYLAFIGYSIARMLVRYTRGFAFRCPDRECEVAILALLWVLVPTAAQAFSSAPMYDGIRHYLVVLPALAVLNALGIVGMYRAASRAGARPIFSLVSVSLFAALLETNIRIHPYQIVYFNQLTGGIPGAKGRFDLDYWGQSFKEAAAYLNKSIPVGSRVWLTPHGTHHFPLDTSRARLSKNYPDYKVNLIRGMMKTWDTDDDYLAPRRPPVYEVIVDDTPILQIFRTSIPELPTGATIVPPTRVPELRPGVSITIPDGSRQGQLVSPSLAAFALGAPTNLQGQRFKMSIRGYVKVDPGYYCISLSSDDAASLRLSERVAIINDSQSTTRKSFRFDDGYYPFDVEWQNDLGPTYFSLQWAKGLCTPAVIRNLADIPPERLFYAPR